MLLYFGIVSDVDTPTNIALIVTNLVVCILYYLGSLRESLYDIYGFDTSYVL